MPCSCCNHSRDSYDSHWNVLEPPWSTAKLQRMNPRNGSPLEDQRHRHHASWNLWSPTKPRETCCETVGKLWNRKLWNHQPGMKKNIKSLKGMWYSNPYTNCHLFLLGGKKSVSFAMSPFTRKSWLEWRGAHLRSPDVFQPSWEKLDKTLVFQWFFFWWGWDKKNFSENRKIGITIKQVQEDMCFCFCWDMGCIWIHLESITIPTQWT